jgi:aminoglycoside phosphotransferase (APT) family kinase protein
MSAPLAEDDVVATHADARRSARPPLLITEPLERFLDEHDLGAGPLAAAPVGEGHSNVTFVIARGDWEAVIRRPPRPPIPPSAHDVLREARMLTGLEGRARVPRVLATCADETVIGAPFYVMQKLEGHVITDTLPAALDTAAERAAIGRELIDALVEIHAVDWDAAGLAGLGKPDGYLERQVRRFSGIWDMTKTRELPDVERVGDWLRAHLPTSPPTTVVHGDFRLGNVMFAPEAPARLIAVFDWEMATLGDPLADVGYLTTMWSGPGDPPPGSFNLSAVTRAEGFPDGGDLVARYEERSGRAVADLRWYRTLAVWKACVFMETNYRRAATGASDDPYLLAFGDTIVELAARARALSRA